mmetsp:Transcript_24739/g.52473  ORF Transcript_24739/g.52473 Transcript_24739/m.52473 type:complete len:649 (-) Transcript_24739:109-2055(-)|eukprot:CAMPEP_0183724260 /NCGR_PEP_ID=MMETSP0737-20130205/17818_1 /TAXON_ID=385413 /ORGANISM="Thalassiosira miniscula, Strain CCMP1093" /LENGTH=648 /DNA_ID=CAMNT_0025954807 /DNA_START=86 /DNA_END=2032 /DNA_ORIENTATION=+
MIIPTGRKLLAFIHVLTCVSIGSWQVSAEIFETSTSVDDCDEVFDFVVVGSGPGGGVVASRLARAGFDTLVLDAGPDYGSQPEEFDVRAPVLWPATTQNPFLEWAFRVQNTDDEEQQDVLYPRSSNVGGCAMHNAMQAVYPFQETFTNLAELTGDNEFAEDKMRQRFIEIEKNEYLPESQDESTGHGTAGFTSTSFGDQRIVDGDVQFARTFGALGSLYPYDGPFGVNIGQEGFPLIINPDINGVIGNTVNFADYEGIHFCPVSISPSKGYIRSGVYGLLKETEGQFSDTLTIKPNSFVTKVLFKTNGRSPPKAYAVKVQEGTSLYGVSTGPQSLGNEKLYCASKEVVVSGGAFNTPQILKLSGIGPKDELEEHGIDVVADLPGVGKNLRDKLEVTVNFDMAAIWKIFEPIAQGQCTLDPVTDPTAFFTSACWLDYLSGNPSIFSSSAVFYSILKKSDTSLPRPDIYIQVTPSRFERYKDGWVQESTTVPNSLSLNLATETTNTEGEITLKSDNPFQEPTIDFKGYSSEDLTRVAQLVSEFSAVISSLPDVLNQVRPEDTVDLDDEQAVKEWVKKNGWGHHACCTAKIGSSGDPDAVLDGQFKVRGVKNLRVVDASSFPYQPGFFPTIPIMMLAEKAADDIIAEYANV